LINITNFLILISLKNNNYCSITIFFLFAPEKGQSFLFLQTFFHSGKLFSINLRYVTDWQTWNWNTLAWILLVVRFKYSLSYKREQSGYILIVNCNPLPNLEELNTINSYKYIWNFAISKINNTYFICIDSYLQVNLESWRGLINWRSELTDNHAIQKVLIF